MNRTVLKQSEQESARIQQQQVKHNDEGEKLWKKITDAVDLMYHNNVP